MAGDRWRPSLSTPEIVAVAVLAVVVALPLALVGLATATGIDVDQRRLFEEYWVVLGALAVGSLLSVPYGLALGLATLPVAARTGLGYGTPDAAAGSNRELDHVSGAVLYVVLAAVAAGHVLTAFLTVAGTPTLVGSLDSALGPALLLAGSGVVASAFLAGQLYQYVSEDVAVDGRAVAGYALYAVGLLPSPFATLLVVDWLVPAFDLFLLAAAAAR